ncbi:HAD family phosphatase [Arthrobacter sp. H5]|uniref:HAD family hydrolase n=1 Tax=Arthrobacter sp. H5 TaxID=1267973 RepID=UPI0004819DA0|nr:HAD family phosphatase [Arthrobacter sp. H5]
MANTNPHWYLFDYGMVISTAPTAEDWDTLEEATGVQLRQDSSPYWTHRRHFDAGDLSSEEYWSLVTGGDIHNGRADILDTLDANQWSHFNLDTLDVLESLGSRGSKLALLSNMPAAMVAKFSAAPWTGYFDQMFFSSRLRLMKPEAAVFERVLAELDAEPAAVTFIDDVEANVSAARRLGIDARIHEPGIDLQKELLPFP